MGNWRQVYDALYDAYVLGEPAVTGVTVTLAGRFGRPVRVVNDFQNVEIAPGHGHTPLIEEGDPLS